MSGRATVIFDFDGTLANSVDLMFRLYNEHVDDFGYLPLKREEFPALRRMGYAKAMRAKKNKSACVASTDYETRSRDARTNG